LAGALLAFGGARDGNIALLVEATAAGFSGANRSPDAPQLFEGDRNSGVGLSVTAIHPSAIDPDFQRGSART
jgi:(2R)-3-sulfolactate dehydrogenase (NADP+)